MLNNNPNFKGTEDKRNKRKKAFGKIEKKQEEDDSDSIEDPDGDPDDKVESKHKDSKMLKKNMTLINQSPGRLAYYHNQTDEERRTPLFLSQQRSLADNNKLKTKSFNMQEQFSENNDIPKVIVEKDQQIDID